jgi:hypothetical protein
MFTFRYYMRTSGWTDKNHRMPNSGQPASGPRSVSGNSRKRCAAKHYIPTSGVVESAFPFVRSRYFFVVCVGK